MNLKLLALVPALGLPALSLTSCGSTGPADVVNPTVAQMDSLDVQWGLPKRTSRGSVRRFDSVSTGSSYTPSAEPAPASTPAPARTTATTEPAPAPAAPAAVDPNVIKNLR